MRRSLLVSLILLTILLVAGCAAPAPQPTVAPTSTTVVAETQTPAATLAPTESPTVQPSPTTLPPTATTAPSPTTLPPTATTAPSATALPPSATPPPPTATAPPTVPPTSTRQVGVTQVQIMLVAIGDNGQSGPLIGCGDSIVPVRREIARTTAPLRAALVELLSLRDQFYGESGLYNALYQSQLSVESVVIDSQGQAIIRLTGQLRLGGVCDNPRVEAQLTETARQFATVRSVAVFINGRPLADVLSLRG